jgi:hypothetical protein
MSDKKKKSVKPVYLRGDVSDNVRFDERGNAVWRWDTERALNEEEDIDKTFNFLKSLDNEDLSLEDSQIRKFEVPGKDPYNTADKK